MIARHPDLLPHKLASTKPNDLFYIATQLKAVFLPF